MLKVMDMTMSQPMLQKSMYDVNLTSLFWSQHAHQLQLKELNQPFTDIKN